ncbi:Transthyretin-like family-containing protein [Strongyloides ratti]|uniref:Transthyretin-like family-containing protein n=1 Tax=Strongyloides ratti TaxID=34506 RepID=A0A090LNK3_STRRB|nr:Transthyretin-like family-containing protein [Strongyloides ratti]CEF71331.1 Transthyretin-like family-containing protein [Strongyloides ratti]
MYPSNLALVSGTTLCLNRPAPNIKIDLLKKGVYGQEFFLKETQSSNRGFFQFRIQADKLEHPRAYIKITYNCGSQIPGCYYTYFVHLNKRIPEKSFPIVASYKLNNIELGKKYFGRRKHCPNQPIRRNFFHFFPRRYVQISYEMVKFLFFSEVNFLVILFKEI